MGNITLTKIFFSLAFIVVTISTFFGVYSNFVVMNNATIEEPYRSAFLNISIKYSELQTESSVIGNQTTAQNVFNIAKATGAATLNVFVTGLESIGKFFEMLPLVGDIFSIIGNVIPELSGIIGLLFIIVPVYFAMRYIQSASNKFDLP